MNQATKQYINDQELAEMIGMSRNWLQIMRVRGGGLRLLKSAHPADTILPRSPNG